MTTTLFITIKVQVESDLNIESLVDEFETETDYTFNSTENVKVLNTEYISTTTDYNE